MGLDPAKMAKSVSDNINEHVQSSLEQVHENIRGYVRELIKQEAPDIPEEHLQELVDTWTPDPQGKIHGKAAGKTGDGGPAAGGGSTGGLPPDLLLTMVRQFLSYSRGSMSIREQQRLREEIPDWQESYWKRFPPRVKKLISNVVKGNISQESFWDRLTSELGLQER